MKLKYSSLKILVRKGAILFAACITLDYVLYPHWVTFSHFATQWYTLVPFIIAIATCTTLLWSVGSKLRQFTPLRSGGTALMASAISAVFIICIPYTGAATQKSIHNTAVLLFVLLAALGIAIIAKRLRQAALGLISATLIGICILELILLAHYNEHPVRPWVWVVLQLILTPLMITALYIIAHVLERRIHNRSLAVSHHKASRIFRE
jgi:hypothetical protein